MDSSTLGTVGEPAELKKAVMVFTCKNFIIQHHQETLKYFTVQAHLHTFRRMSHKCFLFLFTTTVDFKPNSQYVTKVIQGFNKNRNPACFRKFFQSVERTPTF